MKNRDLKILLSVMLIMAAISVFAQVERSLTRKGNGYARTGEWPKADEKYAEATAKKPGMPEATYNWGYSFYNQEKYEEAVGKFADAANFSKDTNSLFKAFYNKGNALLKQDKYPESVEAYKQALRLKPGDTSAQYNLSYALMKMRDKDNQQQNQQNQQNQNQENQQQDKEQQQQKDQEKKEKDQQQQQPKPQNMTKEQAEKMLEALRREEQKLQEEKSKEKKKGTPLKTEKDW